jgi:hypothetical protein
MVRTKCWTASGPAPFETVPFATFGVIIWVVLIAFLAFCVGAVARKPHDPDR